MVQWQTLYSESGCSQIIGILKTASLGLTRNRIKVSMSRLIAASKTYLLSSVPLSPTRRERPRNFAHESTEYSPYGPLNQSIHPSPSIPRRPVRTHQGNSDQITSSSRGIPGQRSGSRAFGVWNDPYTTVPSFDTAYTSPETGNSHHGVYPEVSL
jgi:hypothetical protein